MKWLKENWKRVAKWGGLAVGCVIVALLAFIGARWVSSGAEYSGELIDLTPAEVSMVVRVDSVPVRTGELRRWLSHFAALPDIRHFEATNLFQDNLSELMDGSVRHFSEETVAGGLRDAEQQADQMGVRLFRDVMGGELILASDTGEPREFIALSRVSRDVRFRWRFLDVASMFFPSGPDQPKLDYSRGILNVTMPGPEGATFHITVLDDVLAISNSRRLLNNTVQLHVGGGRGMSANEPYRRAAEAAKQTDNVVTTATIWMNLDRMRDRLPTEPDRDGRPVSPVDTFTSLPPEVVGIYPDIFAPLNKVLEANLDTRPFESAWYSIDLSTEGAAAFHQYLFVAEDRFRTAQYEYLRETWSVPAAASSQLEFLPPDTMFQVTYRQPVSVLFEDVFDARERESFVGDFLVAVQAQAVRDRLEQPINEIGFAALPMHYAPDATMPLSGVDMPLPGFALMFRTPGADPAVAHALLQEYLYAQRGGSQDGTQPPQGAVSVVPIRIGAHVAYAFHDPRSGDDFTIRLNRSIRAALVGDWLILSNSQMFVEHALAPTQSLATMTGSVWRQVPSTGSASLYLNLERFVDYAASPELARVLRDSRFNTGLIEGRDPGEVRREIAAQVGTDDLTHPEVSRIFNERRAEWLRVAAVEGNRFEIEYPRNLRGLAVLGSTGLITNFHEDHLHVQGLMRLKQ